MINLCHPKLLSLTIKSYSGDYDENSRFTGKGKATFIDGFTYEGTFVDGYMHGEGTIVWDDGLRYEGMIEYNCPNGHGKYIWYQIYREKKNLIYRYRPDQSTYEGEIKNGLRHGTGIYSNP